MRSPVLVALKSERRRLAKALKLHDSMIGKLTKTIGKKTGKRKAKAARKSKDTGEVDSITVKDRPAKKAKKVSEADARAAKRAALLGKRHPAGEGGE